LWLYLKYGSRDVWTQWVNNFKHEQRREVMQVIVSWIDWLNGLPNACQAEAAFKLVQKMEPMAEQVQGRAAAARSGAIGQRAGLSRIRKASDNE
jgi:hypothetical protein